VSRNHSGWQPFQRPTMAESTVTDPSQPSGTLLRTTCAMSPLTETNRQIQDQLREERRRRMERQRVVRPIQVIDGLLAELEELHLNGRKRVPDSFDPRLAALVDVCPEARGHELRSRITIVHLMDELYGIQELLLEIKSGLARTLDPGDGEGDRGL